MLSTTVYGVLLGEGRDGQEWGQPWPGASGVSVGRS